VLFHSAATAVQVSLTGFAEIKNFYPAARRDGSASGHDPEKWDRFSDKIMPDKEKRPER